MVGVPDRDGDRGVERRQFLVGGVVAGLQGPKVQGQDGPEGPRVQPDAPVQGKDDVSGDLAVGSGLGGADQVSGLGLGGQVQHEPGHAEELP